MKTNRINRFLGFLRRFFSTSAIVMSCCGLAQAATNTWTGATNANWDGTTANWTSPTTWANGAAAVFPAGSGTVNVAQDITTSGLSISGSDSIMIGGGKTLLLDYATAVPAANGGWGTHLSGPGKLRLDSAQPVDGTANWGAGSAAAISFLPAFTGTLIIDNGRIDSSPAGLGGISQITIHEGGQFLGWTGTYPQPFTLTGDGWGEAGQQGALRAAGGNNCVFTGAVTLDGDAGISSQDNNSVVTFNGVLGGSGSPTLHARGKFNFNGPTSETYTGSLRINTNGANATTSHITFNKPVGAVAVPAGATIEFGYGTLSGQANLRMAASNQFGAGVLMKINNPYNQWTRFDLLGTNQTLAGITTGDFSTTGGGVVQNGGVDVGAAGEATLTLNGSGNYIFNGHMRNLDNLASGAFNLVKDGSGTQTLVSDKITYTGTTTVNAGTLVFAKTSVLNTPIQNNATVEINSVSGDDWNHNSKTLSGGGVWNKTGVGRAAFANSIVTASGQFNILEGTLRNNNNVSNWTGSTASVDISSGAILDLFADAIYVDKLTGSGSVQNGFGTTGQSGAVVNFEKLVVGVANGSSTFAGSIRNNAGTNVAASGTTGGGGGLDLHKVGNGTLTLTGALSYSGVTAITGGALEIGGSATTTLAGAITGSGALLKSGSSRLTLGGASSFSGTTTITGGALTLGGSAPNTAITVNAGTTFEVSATGKSLSSLTLATGSVLSLPATAGQTTTVTGALTLNSSPNLTVKPFFAAAPLVGTFNLLTPASVAGTAGTITTDFGAYHKARGVAGSTALTGGKLVLTVTGTFSGAANLVWNNFGGTGKWSAVTPADNNFDNGGTSSMFYDLDNVAFNGAAPGTVNLTGALYPASIAVNSSTGDYIFAGPGSIGGTTDLVKSGSSALTINTSNTFTGGVSLNSGVLSLGSASALGATPALTFPTGSTATLRLNGNPLTVSALNSGSPLIGSAAIESGAASAGSDLLTVNLAGDNVFAGILRDGGSRALALTKNGIGTLTLAGPASNGFSGDTTLNAGRIGLSKTGGAVAITGNFIGNNGAAPYVFTTENNQFANSVMYFVNPSGDHVRFELLGTTQTLAGIENTTANGRGVIQHKEGVTVGEISNQSTLVLNVAENASYFYNGYLRGNGSSTLALVKNGLGTQQLAGANLTYNGGTTANAGILDFVAPNSMDKATGPWTINAGGTVRATAAQNLYGGVTLNGGTLAGSGPGDVSYGHVVLGGNLTVGGTVTSVISADLRIAGSNDRTFNVAVTGDPSGIDLDVTGKIGHANNVTWGYMTKTGSGTMRFSNPALNTDIGRITLTGGKIIFLDMIAGMGNGGLINEAVAEVSTGTDVAVTYGGTMSGTAGLFAKTGPGSLTLTNATSTFGGAINISGGTLSLPARAAYGDIAVSSGARLIVGNGQILQASGLDLADGATLEVRNFVGDENTPPLDATASLAATGTVSVSVPGVTKSGTFPLIYYPFSGTIGGDGADAFNFVPSNRSVSGSLVDNTGNKSVDLVATVNPVTWKGNLAAGVWDVETTSNWTLNSAATTYQDGDFLLFDDTASSFAVSLDVPVEPGSVKFDHPDHDYSVGGGGSIGGATTLTKTGDRMLTLTGTHTYTGLTTVSLGTLRLGDGTDNGTIASAVANEGTLTFEPSATGQTHATAISGTGSVTKAGAGAQTLTAASPFTGNITVDGGKLIADGPRNGSDTPLGAGLNTRTITVGTGAILEFAVSNVFGNHNVTNVPTLIVNGGTVTNADPTVTNKVNNGLNNVVLNSGTLTSTTGNSLSVIETWRPGEYYGAWGINGGLTSTGASSISSSSPYGVVMLRSSAGETVFDVQDGTLTVAVPLQAGDGDNSGLTKTGAGTLILNAANIYSKPTIISGGTLVLSGSLVKAPGTSATPGQERTPSNITVNSGATLAGGGTATGTVTIEAGATVAPGSGSIAVLHTGSATINGTYKCDVGASTSDGLAVTGDLNLTGATVAFNSVGTPAASVYVIASYTGAYAGGTPAVTGLPTDYTLQVDVTNKQVKLVSSGGYNAWAALKGLDGTNNSKAGDPDSDGVSNQLEYYLNGNPLAGDAAAILPNPEMDGGYLTLTFHRRDDAEAEASSQIVQYGANLSTWPKSVTLGANSAVADVNGVIVQVTENGANPDQIVVRIPAAQAVAGKLFGRLKVTLP